MKKLFNLMLIATLAVNSTGLAIFGGRTTNLAKYVKPATKAAARPFCSATPKITVAETTTTTTHQRFMQSGQSAAQIGSMGTVIDQAQTASKVEANTALVNTPKPSQKKLAWTVAGLTGLAAVGAYSYYTLPKIEADIDNEPNEDQEVDPDLNKALVENESNPAPAVDQEQSIAQQINLPTVSFNISSENVEFPAKFNGEGNLSNNPKIIKEFVSQIRELLASHNSTEVVSYWMKFSRKYTIVDLADSIPAVQKACESMSNNSTRRINQAPTIAEQITDLKPDCLACQNCLQLISNLQERLDATQSSVAPVENNRFQLDVDQIEDELICSDLKRANLELDQSFRYQIIDQAKDLSLILENLKLDCAERATSAKVNLFGNITKTSNWFKLFAGKPEPITTERNQRIYANYTAKKNEAYLIDPLTGYSKIAALEEVLMCYKTILEELATEEKISSVAAQEALKIAQNNPYGEFLLIRLHELSSFIKQ